MTAATRQMLDDVAYARQKALLNRTTVYMVSLPPTFWGGPEHDGVREHVVDGVQNKGDKFVYRPIHDVFAAEFTLGG